jgi:hypothetical protein
VIAQPDKRVIQALNTLDGNADFDVIKQWLGITLKDLQENGAYTKDEVQSRWNQGASQLILEFLKKADTARETLKKF